MVMSFIIRLQVEVPELWKTIACYWLKISEVQESGNFRQVE